MSSPRRRTMATADGQCVRLAVETETISLERTWFAGRDRNAEKLQDRCRDDLSEGRFVEADFPTKSCRTVP